jgi:Ca2+-binding EF-hand superfamily protein
MQAFDALLQEVQQNPSKPPASVDVTSPEWMRRAATFRDEIRSLRRELYEHPSALVAAGRQSVSRGQKARPGGTVDREEELRQKKAMRRGRVLAVTAVAGLHRSVSDTSAVTGVGEEESSSSSAVASEGTTPRQDVVAIPPDAVAPGGDGEGEEGEGGGEGTETDGRPRTGASSRADSTGSDKRIPTRFGPYSALEVIRARRVFEGIDMDGSGSISMAELKGSHEFRQMYSEDRIEAMFQEMDSDSSGDITLHELFRVLFPMAPHAIIRRMIDATQLKRRIHARVKKEARKQEMTARQRAEIAAIFRAFDRDNDGRVTVQEIKGVLRAQADTFKDLWADMDIDNVLSRYDVDGSHSFDVHEFTNMMREVWLSPDATEASPRSPRAASPRRRPPSGSTAPPLLHHTTSGHSRP